jgi:cell filamentation protein
VADRAGHPLNLDKLEPEAFLAAMVDSFGGDGRRLVQQMLLLTTR